MKKMQVWLLLGLTVTLAGCASVRGPSGYLRDPNNDLTDTRTMPGLRTPPGLPVLPTDPYYTVGQVGTVPAGSNVPLAPPGSLALLSQTAAKAPQVQ